MFDLNILELKEVNGGSQESYEAGLKAGKTLQRQVTFMGFLMTIIELLAAV